MVHINRESIKRSCLFVSVILPRISTNIPHYRTIQYKAIEQQADHLRNKQMPYKVKLIKKSYSDNHGLQINVEQTTIIQEYGIVRCFHI